MTNFYETLGVKQDADEGEIKKAYRKMSLQYHPDRNNSEDAKKKMTEINEAYENLGETSKRSEYDHKLKYGDRGGARVSHGGHPFGEMNDIFNMMFNSRGGNGVHVFHSSSNGGRVFTQTFRTARPPPAVRTKIDITLEQCYSGMDITIHFERTIVEKGERREEKEEIVVNISRGTENGEQMLLKGKGNIVDGQAGDIHLIVNVLPHDMFTRKGLDLHMSKKISLKEALTEFSFDINHLNGKRFRIQNSATHMVICPGYQKVIPNMGIHKNSGIGNMVILFEVEYPSTLDAEKIARIAELEFL